MKCPYCNNELQQGIIAFGMRSKAVWRPNEECSEVKKIIVVPYSFDCDEIEAAFCNNCKKMVLDLRELKKPEPLFIFMKRRDDGTLTR